MRNDMKNYNAVLTLAHLHEHSDGVILFHNNQLNRIATQMLNIKHPSLQELNWVLCRQLASALLPCAATSRPDLRPSSSSEAYHLNPLSKSSSFEREVSLSNHVEHLCSHAGFKMLDIMCVEIQIGIVNFFFEVSRAISEASGQTTHTAKTGRQRGRQTDRQATRLTILF